MSFELLSFVVAVFFILLCIDWRQTLTIAQNPTKFYELNPILGRHPSVKKVNLYFGLVTLISASGVYMLSGWADKYLLPITIVAALMEAVVVVHNVKLGIEMD